MKSQLIYLKGIELKCQFDTMNIGWGEGDETWCFIVLWTLRYHILSSTTENKSKKTIKRMKLQPTIQKHDLERPILRFVSVQSMG